MKRPFSIFIDSSDVISKTVYPKNTSMEFTVEIPERMDFRKDWHVTFCLYFYPNFFSMFLESHAILHTLKEVTRKIID